MKITTSNYNVLETGSVIVPSGEYLEFEIQGLRYRFSFKKEKNEETGEYQSSITGSLIEEDGDKRFVINIVNYDSLFSSTTQMLNVGTIKGKTLSVRFSIVALDENETKTTTRVFHYTWYLEK